MGCSGLTQGAVRAEHMLYTELNAQLHKEFLRADTVSYSCLEDYLPIISLKKDYINIFRFSRLYEINISNSFKCMKRYGPKQEHSLWLSN